MLFPPRKKEILKPKATEIINKTESCLVRINKKNARPLDQLIEGKKKNVSIVHWPLSTEYTVETNKPGWQTPARAELSLRTRGCLL